ncbi:MAG: hypothetical protein FIB04_00200 [Gammaproteobacteria bacterium]|nr:hypothetical protein [Gammaproteobacteria bacterium]
MYEHHRQPVLPRPLFMQRVRRHGALSAAVIVFSVTIGTLGYGVIGNLPWLDAFLNASMILAGMGPVDRMETPGAKLFAALYALYSGIVFIATAGVLLAPFLHRMLHRLHLEG